MIVKYSNLIICFDLFIRSASYLFNRGNGPNILNVGEKSAEILGSREIPREMIRIGGKMSQPSCGVTKTGFLSNLIRNNFHSFKSIAFVLGGLLRSIVAVPAVQYQCDP